MKRDMSRILARIFTVALLTMVSMGAEAKIDVQIGKFTGGTIEEKSQTEPDEKGFVTVTITVTPNKEKGYTIKKGDISVYSTLSPSGPSAGTRALEIADNLTLYFKGSADADTDDLSAERDYTFNVPSGFGAWVKEANFQPKKRDGAKDTTPSGTDYSGYRFIANYNGYNKNNKPNNFYLIPSIMDYIDANSQQPFLTTYKSYNYTSYDHPSDYTNLNDGCPEDHSLWEIIFAGTETIGETSTDYWYLKHVSSSLYLCFNDYVYEGNKDRARVHLESKPENSTEDKWKFSITAGAYTSTTNPLPLAIIPKGEEKSLNPAKDSKPEPYGVNQANPGNYQSANGNTVYFAGIVGYYVLVSTDGKSTKQAGSHWILETPVCETPVITYEGGGNISISTTTPGATIYYTMGDSPNAPSGTETTHGEVGTGTAAFTITGPTTIKAIAVKDHYNNSVVAEKNVIKVATPVIAENAEHAISITCDTEGATIYYTTDGTAPLTTSSVYSTPLTDASNKLIRAIAVKDQCIDSDESSETIVVSCARPVITKEGMTYTITCPFPTEATIYYSTDGSEPTTIYGGSAISFTDSDLPFTVKAIAKKTDYSDSETSSRYFGTNLSGGGTSADPYLIKDANDFEVFVDLLNEDSEIRDKYFKIDKANVSNGEIDLSGSSTINSGVNFSGTFDGEMVILSGLSHSLFNSINGGTVKNVILDNVNIPSGGTNVGAICNEATGDSRIYNCGVLATGSTVTKNKDGYDVITSCGSTINGSGYVGGIVGLLDGSSRVINCFSYANILGGNKVGGIVGWNNVATNANSEDAEHYLKAMVMNCMFYGDITGGSSKAPVYNGEIITNDGDNNGVSNFNYFFGGASYVNSINTYNCALSAETRYLQRFEFFRHLLNSNRELAAWWVDGQKGDMAKWVLDKSVAPFPILKKQGYYPSVVNHIAAKMSSTDNTSVIDYTASTAPETPETQKTLKVTLSGAGITTTSLTLPITDKDPDNFNFNYHKVQLPYFNDVGTGNYMNGQVVTGWEVTVSGGTHGYSTGADGSASVNDETGEITLTTPYNFADRKSTEKDNYGTSRRIFSQGAYFDVPEGVTSISIVPHWGKAVFIADASLDVVYDQSMANAYNVPSVGGGERYTNGQSYTFTTKGGNITLPVYTKLGGNDGALKALFPSDPTGTVYDNALVLVGNFHSLALSSDANNLPYTIMSADFNHDNEPDNSYILRFNDRKRVHPVRIDFLDAIGLGMAQKSTGGSGTYNFGIMQPLGWFESTNTSLFRVTQFEYDRDPRSSAPMILLGGVIEQWVTVAETSGNVTAANAVDYYHVGSNVWFKEFHIGAHQDRQQVVSSHPPISVTGGDFDIFYLTGMYNTPNTNYDDNAECYINGGRFGKVAGTGMQGIGGFTMNGTTKTNYSNGNIIWQIDNADIDEFYAGGINAAHIAEGNIWTVIRNSRVDQFCGGPKFGNMNSDKKVVTNATNCTFRTFFGAGYGGNSYNREYPTNKYNAYNYGWNTWLTSVYKKEYKEAFKGVSTRIDYQFIPKSDNTLNVGRLFVDYISFSLATTYDVTSKLTDCTITTSPLGRLSISDDYQCLGSFYGGGSLGMVDGPVKSTLTNCTVEGNVFGGGYSATLPTVQVMNNNFQREPSYDTNTGAYTEAILPTTESYTWEQVTQTEFNTKKIDTENHILYTTETLMGLGAVTGNVTLTIDGNTALTNGKRMSVAKSVYGGGEESNVEGNTQVNITGGTITENVFGGGKGKDDNFTCDKAMVGVNDEGACENPALEANKDKGTKVSISNGTVNGNVYGGGEVGRVEWNTQVEIGVGTGDGSFAPIINGSVFGAGAGKETHGYSALVRGNSTVTVQGNAKVLQNVYGGGEKATVGRYWVKGIPTTPCNNETAPSEPTDLPDGMPYQQRSGGICKVVIQGQAQIGPDEGGNEDVGHVFGAGKGVVPHFVQSGEEASQKMIKGDENNPDRLVAFDSENAYLEFLQTLALVTNTDVTIGGGAKVKGSVFGGSESGYVQHNTNVKVSAGTIGTAEQGGAYYGNVYGGGKGDAEHTGSNDNYIAAGIVKGYTKVTIEGGTILHNIYGGGAYGTVGVFDYDTTSGLPTGLNANAPENSGKAEIHITGGTIGTTGEENGMIFGSSRGDVGAPGSIHDKLAWVYDTHVVIGSTDNSTDLTKPLIKGSVYGSGENGHTFTNTVIDIHSGTVGIAEDATYPFRGNVYGGGCGTDTYSVGTGDDKKEYFNPLAGIVFGNTTVNMDGGRVIRTIYGGGAMGSVGTFTNDSNGKPATCAEGTGLCTVNISGGKIGPEVMAMPNNYGNVFGAGRGEVHDLSKYPNLEKVAYFSKTEVNINEGALVKGSVYGGSESGHVLNDTWVKINGGQVGCGDGLDAAYSDWNAASMKECPSWPYEGQYAPYDKFAGTEGYNADGGSVSATDGHTFYGNVFGGGSGYEPYAPGKWVRSAGIVEGNTKVEISDGHILTSVYGGNEQTDVGNGLKLEANIGKCTVTMSGGTVGVPRTHAERLAHPVTGNIFGAGKGDKRLQFNTWTNVGETEVTISGGTVYGSVFGGGEDGHVLGDASTTISGSPIIGTLGTTGYDGNVFGGGRGSVTALTAGVVCGSVSLNIENGSILGSVYGGGRLASLGTYLVPPKADGNSDTDNPKYGKQIPDGKQQVIGGDDETVSSATHGHVMINISGGTIGALGDDGNLKSSLYSIGDVYGGCKGTTDGNLHDVLGVSTNSTINFLGGTVRNAIYGGGEVGNVGELGQGDPATTAFAKINLLGGSVMNVYGGGLGKLVASQNIDAKAYVKGNVTVNLNGLEKDDYETMDDAGFPTGFKKTDILDEHEEGSYTFYRVKDSQAGCVVNGIIFGCNNVNGTPEGHSKVHVFKTQARTGQAEDEYDIAAVYGGGNRADYEPTDNVQSTEVIVEGCGVTSIQQVYGGGNAAASPATKVTIKGTKLIDEVFGGGNGVSTETFENPGANVGYHTDKTPYTSGDGKAYVELMAGTIHSVYGGSNSNGDIRNGSNITKPTPAWVEAYGDDASCCSKLTTNQVFGGGKNANQKSGTKIVLGCMDEDWIEDIYAGAEMADVKGDVSLTLTSGKFGRVFGGNKKSGILDGSIEVNIEENPDCDQPIIIGELYGGGNEAAYSIYGYNGNDPRTKEEFDAMSAEQKAEEKLPHNSPVVNVRAFTSIGNIFGGGYGLTAKMYGSPKVNINEVNRRASTDTGDNFTEKTLYFVDGVLDKNMTTDPSDMTKVYKVVLPSQKFGKIGAINNVFGGGNAAQVIGNTEVNIGTESQVYVVKPFTKGAAVPTTFFTRSGTGTTSDPYVYTAVPANTKAEDGVNYYELVNVVGADIRGNVYGGGNEAEVTGNTNVVIGKKGN